MKPSHRQTIIRETLENLNHCRGRGSIHAVRLFADGTGEADRQGQYFTDTIRFRVESRGERFRVFALRSSRMSSATV